IDTALSLGPSQHVDGGRALGTLHGVDEQRALAGLSTGRQSRQDAEERSDADAARDPHDRPPRSILRKRLEASVGTLDIHEGPDEVLLMYRRGPVAEITHVEAQVGLVRCRSDRERMRLA